MNFTRRTGLIAGAILLATAGLAQAADWPTDPITFMVTTPTGGSEDRLVRTLAPYLSEELGVPVVVENIDGAQGILGADRLLRQGGDGSRPAAAAEGTVAARGRGEALGKLRLDLNGAAVAGGFQMGHSMVLSGSYAAQG